VAFLGVLSIPSFAFLGLATLNRFTLANPRSLLQLRDSAQRTY
jgi:hypothetical protein